MASLHMMTLPYFYGSSKNCCFVATKYLSYSKSLALLAYTKGKKHCGCVSIYISNEWRLICTFVGNKNLYKLTQSRREKLHLSVWPMENLPSQT